MREKRIIFVTFFYKSAKKPDFANFLKKLGKVFPAFWIGREKRLIFATFFNKSSIKNDFDKFLTPSRAQ